MDEFLALPQRGVTTLISHVFGIDFSGIPDWVMETAQERGTAVHSYIENTLQDNPYDLPMDYWEYRDNFTEWLQTRDIEVHSLESYVVGDDYKGVVDFVGLVDGVPTIIDWKTTSNLKGDSLMSANMQLNIYGLHYPDHQLMIVNVKKDMHQEIIVERNETMARYVIDLFKYRCEFKKPRRSKSK